MVGLSPENVSQALSGAINTMGLKQQKIKDLIDMKYKESLIKESEARAKANSMPKLPGPLDRKFVGDLTLREFNSLTPDAKEYILAKQGAKVLGDDRFMTRREWAKTKPSEREKFLTGLMEKPELLSMEKELREASRSVFNMGEFAAKEKTKDIIGAQSAATSAKRVTELEKLYSIDNIMRDDYSQVDSLVKKYNLDPMVATEVIKKAKVREAIDNDIRQAYINQPIEYVKGKGWYSGDKLIRRDPYAVR